MSPLDISSSPNQRRLAKEFASSLEQSHRSTRNDVHGYVEFAQHLSETEGPVPDPSFREALRHRLLHELIEDELVPQHDELALRRDERTRRKGGSHCFERAPREPWIAAASTVLVVCGGAVGLGQDSSQTLPGDVLYPVKRFFESGELALANSTDGQARELMDQATERLDEARELVQDNEIHSKQALPETIVDFNEATTDAGNLIVEQSRADAIDPAIVSEFRSFTVESRTALDEIAESADGKTASLIEDARSTLDSFDDLLPVLDPVLDTADETPIAAEALNVLGLGGSEHADHVNETPLEASSTDAAEAIDSTVSSIDDTVNDTLADTTAALTGPVSVVELSSGTVSMAVATVHNSVKAVDRAVSNTLKTVDKTLEQATAGVRETVHKTTEAAQQAVRDAAQVVDDSVQTAADDTVDDAVGALQGATGGVL
ncbi:MAG TPA: DUF5667 domain-containing protein [Nocardioidaceae bacterium]|nr:DUF5667 domain-containing protein [Nocardioidaceae bacterium]